MTAAVSDGTLRCPAAVDGLVCRKHIPAGWTADDGHSGGHVFASDQTWEILQRGHFDATALISGAQTEAHLPERCSTPDAVGCQR